MTDIVERLRETRGILDNRWPGPSQMDLEAAAEIERLRNALRPFAKLLEMIECTTSHDYSDTDEWDVPIGDLRRANSALPPSLRNAAENTGGGQ